MADLDEALRRLVDEAEIRGLSLRYAQAVDRRDADALTALFTPDGALEGSGVVSRGREQIGKIPPMMKRRYDKTYHTLFNQFVAVDGDAATGEVYSMAHHLNRQEDGRTCDLVMAITYRDRYVRTADGWRFAHRGIELQWKQTAFVDPDDKV